MSWQFVLFTALPLVSATLLAVVGIIAWRHRPAPSAAFTAVVIWLASAWSLAYAGELAAVDLDTKTLFARSEYLAIVFIPMGWLGLVLQYTDRGRWITPRNVALAAAIPIITLALALTPGFHHLMWDSVALDDSGPVHVLKVTYGPWFWLFVVYAYVIFCGGIYLLLRAYNTSTALTRGQIIALLISVLAPMIGNLLYLTRLTPIANLELTTYAFLITGLALLWGLLKSQFLGLVPMARGRVVERMNTGFLVLSPQGRIVDINTATLHMLDRTTGDVLGQPVHKVLGARFGPVPTIHQAQAQGEVALGEVALGEGEKERTYAMRSSPLLDRRGHLLGHVILFSDVTDQKRIQIELEDTIRRKDIAYQQALIYSNELNQQVKARQSAEEALRALSHKLSEVQETERRHLARELHDEIGQALTGLRFILESGLQNGSNRLNEGLQVINDLIEQVHDLSLNLRPTVLDDLGLLPALLWYIERYTAQRGITVAFKHRGLDRRFDTSIETAVYRIVQEGLTNVSKYAGVDTVDVSLWTTENSFQVQIEDSGVGFSVAQALSASNSSGLVGMKERVTLLGGVFSVDSAPGEGTRLSAELPLNPALSERRP
ncbi:MAG: PAS domain-containing protein [Chloroflexi bacterium]|nr:PAS domain-containing protein [Chloroflexota bacterium]